MAHTISRKLAPRHARLLAVALLAILALAPAACGDDGDDPAEATTTDASSEDSGLSDDADTSESSDPEAEDSDSTDPGGGGSLVGLWTADAAETLAANTANMGMPAGITCNGPITLDFADDQSFTAGGTAECAAGGLTISGTMNTTGTWAVVEEGTVEISGTTSDGSFDVPGIEIPAVDVMSDGSFAYAVEGDTLTITFSDPATGEVQQVWTRV